MTNVFTDGASTMNKNNGKYIRGNGGWSFVIMNSNNQPIFGKSGSESQTTNQRMELIAIKKAIEYNLENGETDITIYSDSAYSINIYTQWIKNWEANGWARGAKRAPIENLDIIKSTWELMAKANVFFVKVKGHSNSEGNNLADSLAVEAKKNQSKERIFNFQKKEDCISFTL